VLESSPGVGRRINNVKRSAGEGAAGPNVGGRAGLPWYGSATSSRGSPFLFFVRARCTKERFFLAYHVARGSSQGANVFAPARVLWFPLAQNHVVSVSRVLLCQYLDQRFKVILIFQKKINKLTTHWGKGEGTFGQMAIKLVR
jgi:hypothetical protein